jgi:hypothetical protein
MPDEPMPDDIVIRGHARLEWSDQLRFVLRKLGPMLWKCAVVITVMFAVIWALTLPDEEWLALRVFPLASLGDFVADAWPFFVATLVALVVLTIGSSYLAFRRFPDANLQISYEADVRGLLTRDAADFALMVPWSSITRARNTGRILYLKTVPGAWRYLLWRAFAPADRDQILRWATKADAQKASGDGKAPGSREPPRT